MRVASFRGAFALGRLSMVATIVACAQGAGGSGGEGASDFGSDGTSTGGTTGPTSAGPAGDPSTSTATTTVGDASDTTDGTDDDGPPGCGNGIEDEGEACDDGNRVQADGCNNDCVLSGTLLWSHSQANGRGGLDQARGIASDDEDDAYVAGSVFTATMTPDAWLRRYDSPGGIEWTNTVDGGAMGDDVAYAVARDGGALFFAGQRSADGSTFDAWLARYDLAGSQSWSVTYDGGLAANDAALGVAITPGDEVVIAGYVAVMDQGNDVLVRKYNAAGDPVWTSTYSGPTAAQDRGYAIAVDSDGSIAVAGWETTSGMQDVWVRKYAAGGAEIWTRGFAGAAGLDDQGFGVAFDTVTHEVVVGGVEGTAMTTGRTFLRKYDVDGNELWTQSEDGSTGEGAAWRALAIGVGGVIAVVGSETNTAANRIVVRKLAADGSPLWTTIEDATGPAVAYAVAYVGDGLYVAGTVDKGIDGVDTWVGRFAP